MAGTKIAGALGAGLLALGLMGSPAAVAGSPVTAGAPPLLYTSTTFNKPGEPQIVSRLEELIRGADRNSQISIAERSVWDEEITNALKDAAAKNDVRVRVLVDAKATDHPNYESLKKSLNGLSFAKDCSEGSGQGGCNGDNAMHNKFFLFSKTMGEENVVATSSANLSGDTLGGTGGWNSLYTDVGNDDLYRRYEIYFDHMVGIADGAKTPDDNYYDTFPPVIHGDAKSYFYPRKNTSETGRDPAYNTLKEVDCDAQKTTIRVAMWSISRTGVSGLLNKRARKGCKVQVLANQITPAACEKLTVHSPDSPGWSPVQIRGFKDRDHGMHQKDMMIEGHYLHDDTKVVFTGSHNLNYTSLFHNDENVIRVMNNQSIYNDYIKNFERVWVHEDTNINVDYMTDCDDIAPPAGINAEQDVM